MTIIPMMQNKNVAKTGDLRLRDLWEGLGAY